MRIPKQLPILVLASTLVACGGGGGGSSIGGGSPPPVNAAVGGIWEGTSTIAGQGTVDVIGLVAEDGRLHFLQSDGVQYWGNVSSSGNSISASFQGAVEFGDSFVDGSVSGSGTLTGTIQARSTLSGTSAFTTSGGAGSTSTISLTYNTLYDRDSSLATIAGNYTFAGAPGSDSVTVSSNGVLFGQDPATSCVTNGQVSVIDSRFNAYDIEYTYSSCAGQFSILNGATFRGIGTLDNTVTPEVAIAGLEGTVQGTRVVTVFIYQRT